MQFSAADIANYAAAAGFTGDDLPTAVAIALAESNGDPNAYNPESQAGAPAGKGSYGLWQIYLNAHPQFAGWNLYDPRANAAAAFTVYTAAGNSFAPWTTFKSGAYTAYLSTAQDGVIADAQGLPQGPSSPALASALDFTNPIVIAIALVFGVLVLKDFFD